MFQELINLMSCYHLKKISLLYYVIMLLDVNMIAAEEAYFQNRSTKKYKLYATTFVQLKVLVILF